MQFGHVGIALLIATCDWRPETIAVVAASHFLPNGDTLLVKTGIAKEGFHFSITHTLLFAAGASALVALFSPYYGFLALVSILAHYLADMPTDTGIMLFWPFSRRRFSFNLWKDTGYWGAQMFRGYYSQPFAWILELPIFFALGLRMLQIYVVK